MNSYLSFSGVTMAVLLAGCSAVHPKQTHELAPLPPTNANGDYQVMFPPPKPAEDRLLRLSLSQDARAKCDFSPHFAYNSTEPLPQDRMALRALADCLNSPEAYSDDILLVGRADAHGSSQYNLHLARARAFRVRDLLMAEGIDRDRIQVASRGEYGARGVGMVYSHGSDRRVDVMLKRTAHVPGPGAVSSDARQEPDEALRDARREVAFEARQQRIKDMRAAMLLSAKVK